ncbi:MAG: hypothetical protein KY461_11040, partial [Actinobacteria bacterium]|nr:hypothetical protein [Actinomycetota bacterium]
AIGDVGGWRLHVVAAGILLAAAAKSGQVPFAPWLFSAMAGPTQASALLHSATLVSAGAYLLIRVSPSLQAVGWFAPAVVGVGLVTALAAGLVALTQPHIKRSLAGSTSAQYGLMFLAVGAGSTAAAGAHLVAHALFKSLLFLAAGAAIHAVNGSDMARMRLGRSLPKLAALAAVGAAALAAVPPLGGAWTKEQILAASFERSTWLGAATLLAALLTVAYASRWWLLTFGRRQAESPAGADRLHRPPGSELAALGALAVGSVLLGLLWLPAGSDVVEALVGGSLAHGEVTVLLAAWAVVLLTSGGMAWLHRRGRLVDVGLSPRVTGPAAAWFGLPFLARVAVVDPVLGFARLLARGDDVVVDAGVRGAARLARAASRSFSRFGELSFTAAAEGLAGGALTSARWLRRRAERGVDAVVRGLAAGTDGLAVGSRFADDRGIDAAVEGLARLTAAAGQHARHTQTGLSHRYYLYAAVGAAVAVLTLAVFR